MEDIDVEKIKKAKQVVSKFNEEERFRDGGVLNNSIDMLLKYIKGLEEEEYKLKKWIKEMKVNYERILNEFDIEIKIKEVTPDDRQIILNEELADKKMIKTLYQCGKKCVYTKLYVENKYVDLYK